MEAQLTSRRTNPPASFTFQKSALAVKKLESEKCAIQRELDPILAKTPLGPNASSLPLKLSTANNKTDELNALLDLYNKK